MIRQQFRNRIPPKVVRLNGRGGTEEHVTKPIGKKHRLWLS